MQTYLMVMGTQPIAFYGSHFLIGVAKATLIVGVCVSVFASSLSVRIIYNFSYIPRSLQYVSTSLFVVFSLAFAVAAISFGLLCSVVVRKPTLALTAALMAWVMLIVLDGLYSVSPTNIAHCFLCSLNVYSAFKLGVKAAIMSETTGLLFKLFCLESTDVCSKLSRLV